MKKSKRMVFLAVIYVLIFGLLTSLFLLIENKGYYQKRVQYLYIAANQSSIIEGCMDTVIARTYTLSAMVVENKGETDFFDQVAKQVYDEVKTDTGVMLKNIAIAPDGIIEKVYPLKGNEGLVGFNFMDESKEGNKAAIKAYQQGDLVITNPFALTQGGNGIAGRLPVFLEENGTKKLWGLVTVTLDYDMLMKFFELETLSNMGVDYSLWYADDNGNKTILRQSENAPQNAVTYKANPKNLEWNLDVSPSGGWINVGEIILGMLLIFFISTTLVYILLTREKIKSANEEIMHANEKLKVLAIKDSLTDCYSRHYVNTMLLQLPEGRWNRADAHYSLVIADIDKFKSINDTYGHDVGDKAIVAVSQAFKETCDEKRGDCVIRHGGDEFVILYNDVSKSHLISILDKILQKVQEIRLENYPEIRLTVSIGASLGQDNKKLYYDLLNEADEKLYQSKENGRNQYTL